MKSGFNYRLKKRIYYLFLFLILILGGLAARLVWIQVVNSEYYQQKAMDQRLRLLNVEPARGIIYDRNGNKLAISASSPTVVAIPREINNKEETAHTLAEILDMDYDRVLDRISREAGAVYVERKISEEEERKILKLDLPGITFTEESKRHYPQGSTAAHILGFAGIDSQGLEGIELSYDKYLRGIPGKIMVEKDASGQTIPEGMEEYIPPRDGYNLHLTLDEVIQYIAERELDKALDEFDISGGSVIIMNPGNGEILALANRPHYDPNRFADFPQKNWRNRAISDSFEPGSTFKIITTAASLEEGVVHENDIFVDPGFIRVSGERIDCWKAGGHGRQTFAEVVKNSCNTGFVQVGMRLGREDFYNYITAFGFGEETNIKLPGEARGLVYGYDQIGPVELATMTFGHGISVTPIQLTAAVSAIANNGMLLRPRLVDEISNNNGEILKKMEPVQVRQVVSEETARRTRELLARVVSDGTGRAAQIEGYQIGGKTGTARHYRQEIYDSSFVGIVPIDKPELVILVVLYDVDGEVYYGSQTAAPVFKNITIDVLRYLDIPPQNLEGDEDKKVQEVRLPELTGMAVNDAQRQLRNLDLNVRLIGEGTTVIEQIPLAGAFVKTGTTVILFTENEPGNNKKYYVAVPDFRGLKEEEAVNLAAELGLKIKYSGKGEIISQDVEPGMRIPGGSTITVTLK